MESDDVLRLQMSIIVTMENTSKEFEENTQDLLDHLSIIYVATDKSESSGMADSLNFSGKIYFGSPASSFCIIYLEIADCIVAIPDKEILLSLLIHCSSN